MARWSWLSVSPDLSLPEFIRLVNVRLRGLGAAIDAAGVAGGAGGGVGGVDAGAGGAFVIVGGSPASMATGDLDIIDGSIS